VAGGAAASAACRMRCSQQRSVAAAAGAAEEPAAACCHVVLYSLARGLHSPTTPGPAVMARSRLLLPCVVILLEALACALLLLHRGASSKRWLPLLLLLLLAARLQAASGDLAHGAGLPARAGTPVERLDAEWRRLLAENRKLGDQLASQCAERCEDGLATWQHLAASVLSGVVTSGQRIARGAGSSAHRSLSPSAGASVLAEWHPMDAHERQVWALIEPALSSAHTFEGAAAAAGDVSTNRGFSVLDTSDGARAR
jgi:hypothetical protein